MCSAGVNVGPEKIRFKREVNGRKVCKELIGRIEPRGCTSETGDNTVLQLQLALANDTRVGFAIIKYQIACKGI